MIVPNNDTLAEMLEGTRDALEKALAKVTKLESANSALANQVLVYARRAEDAIQLRNLLEAVREDNQRLRAELSEIRAQDSDLAEHDEPLTPEDEEARKMASRPTLGGDRRQADPAARHQQKAEDGAIRLPQDGARCRHQRGQDECIDGANQRS